MASGIYKILDKTNQKIYIGQSKNLENRKWRHFCYTHPEDYLESSLMTEINMPIHQAMIKSHNSNNFIFEILEYCDYDLLDDREKYYIKLYDCMAPKGYNKTEGGQNKSKPLTGEQHYNHKITQAEAELIKKMLAEKFSTADIIQKIPNATVGIICHINNGRTWKDKNINYPISRLNGVIKFDNETVMEIRRREQEGEKIIDLAEEFNTSHSTISSICNGTTHQDIPVLKKNIQSRNLFTEEQVNFYRKQYYLKNIPIKTLYENSIFKNEITYDGFKNMVNGSSYKQYKIYNKDIKTDNLINRNNQIRELVKEGKTKKEIAKIIGCSERTVYRAINKENSFE